MSDANDENIDICEKENDDLFLDLIKERPTLYNKSLKDHHDKIIKENAMQEIAFIMNETVEQCEKRWSRLQNTFRREKYLQDVLTKSGSGASVRRKWQFFDRMQNMLSGNQSRSSYSNIQSTSARTYENSTKEVSYNTMKYNSKKKKSMPPIDLAFNQIHGTMNKVLQTVQQNEVPNPLDNTTNNPDDLFGKLIGAELNILSPKAAKKKRKSIILCLAQEDSDSENST